MGEGAPRGRPAWVCGGRPTRDCGRLPSWACWGCRGAGGMGEAFGPGWSGRGKAILLQRMISVVENIGAAF
jgi:hypothetical protein